MSVVCLSVGSKEIMAVTNEVLNCMEVGYRWLIDSTMIGSISSQSSVIRADALISSVIT